ncbi:MAG: ankyrin repeat protein [Harvfovirus sp.]|uniref:Ankyrin repeat protein n=1 Tax=Harvfovirus sp. TaxID=2487768 RepID=A0A3G5A942_9VIRU|nr:MAG: ankyrin repeat protein [Harvfovirus sp.]
MTDIIFGVNGIDELILKVRKNDQLRKSICNLEDSLAKIFSIDKKSSSLDINFPLLWETPENRIRDNKRPLTSIPLDPKYNGFVIGGKVLEYVTDCVAIDETYNIFFYDATTHEKFMEMLLEEHNNIVFVEKNDERYRVKWKEYNINVFHKIFGTVTEILLEIPKYINRFCFDCGKMKFYGSGMFYLELDRLAREVNPLSACGESKKILDGLPNLHKLVNSIDVEAVRNYVALEQECEILDSKGHTALERAIIMYVNLNNAVLRKNLVNIIGVLTKFVYRRDMSLVLYQYSDTVREIYDIVRSVRNKYGLNIRNKDLVLNKDVNSLMVSKLLVHGEHVNGVCEHCENVVDYLTFFGRVNSDIFCSEHLEKDMLRALIPKIKIDKNFVAEIILKNEMIDLFSVGNFLFDELFLKDIVVDLIQRFKFVSLLYLIRREVGVMGFKYDRPIWNYFVRGPVEKVRRMILFLTRYGGAGKNYLEEADECGNVFIHKVCEKRTEIVRSLGVASGVKNIMGDTYFHVLARKNAVVVMRGILEEGKGGVVMNERNGKGQTVLLLAAKENYEELFTLLLQHGANDMIPDELGNTVYHYIVVNKMFIGSVVIETENYYGFKPSYYTFLKKYWRFKDGGSI